MTKKIDISIIIVNFNGANFINNCLDSILNSRLKQTYEIIIVDNASADASLEVLEKYKDSIILVKNSENTGFSYANNQAIKLSKGDYLFILNNDTELHPDAIQKLYDYYIAHPSIGAVAPKLLNEDGSLQCQGSSTGHWRFKQNKTRAVPFIAGAAFLIHKDVMAKMGGMDENLFFYNDDIDMCRFMRQNKYPIIYYPETTVTHFGGLSTKYRRKGSLIEGYRGGIYLAQKYYGKTANVVYRLFLLLDLIPNIIGYFIASLFKKSSKEMLEGYLQVLWIAITNDVYLEREKVKRGIQLKK